MRVAPLLALAACAAQPEPVRSAPAAAPAPTAAATGLTPNEIVAAAPKAEWRAIAADDLLVMTLPAVGAGKPRQVVLQLIPAPWSSGWTDNIRTLARAHWYDGIAVVRVQDNYVVQWGDPDGEDTAKAKPLPAGLKVMSEADYVHATGAIAQLVDPCHARQGNPLWLCDSYAPGAGFRDGWPIATDGTSDWPVHCYGAVGVGRGYAPDTGTGAELYTVIGHAPRQLDRNIAVVGRVVEGIEHLSSLPRGTGELSFYETVAERTPIVSIRLASEIAAGERPRFEYLDTSGTAFREYARARANRQDAFYAAPAGGVDVCNVPVPVRRVRS